MLEKEIFDYDPFEYLELLRSRPRKRPFESLNSWLIRVALSNNIRSRNKLYFEFDNFLKDNKQPILSTRAFAKAKTLLRLLDVELDYLLEMTPYFLQSKFYLPENEIFTTAFLRDLVSPYQRFCPKCVKEFGYYSILWLFKFLPGCEMHKNRLLDKCSECGYLIPYLPDQLSLGICPNCKTHFGDMYSPSLTDIELAVTMVRTFDLKYLLTPLNSNVSIREQFRRIRKEYRLDTREIRRILKLHIREFQLLEQDNGFTPFQTFLGYADYLGLTLSQVLSWPTNPIGENISIELVEIVTLFEREQLIQKSEAYEAHVLSELKNTELKLIQESKPITKEILIKTVGESERYLNIYPSLKEYLRYVRNNGDGKIWAIRIQRVAEELRKQGRAPFMTEVAIELGQSKAFLEKFDECTEIIAEITVYAKNCRKVIDRNTGAEKYLHLWQILELVKDEVLKLHEQKQRIHKSEIAFRVGCHSGVLNEVEIAKFLEDYI